MIIMKRWILILAAMLLFCKASHAGSPLESIDFYRAYLDVPIVKAAADNPHKLTEEMMEYLYDDANPLDIRIALINAVGCSVEWSPVFGDFIDYWVAHHLSEDSCVPGATKTELFNVILYEASCWQMAVLVYLQAMSRSMDIENNYAFFEYAMMTPLDRQQSFMTAMGLVLAQTAYALEDWGGIYEAMIYYLFSPDIKDMRPEAVKIIMNYVDQYKEYATE